MSIVILVRVGFLFITKHFYFSALILNYWIESIATDPSTVMFLTHAWKNVLKENMCGPDSGHDECCICLEVKYLYPWREQTYS